MRDYIFVNTFDIAESAGNDPQLGKTEFTVQIQRRLVAFDHGVELQYSEPGPARLFHAVFDQHFAHMLPAEVICYSVTCVANVSAASHIVGVEYV